MIVPDGPLFDINFESLPVQTGGSHYWLRDVTVSVAPSLSLFLRPDDAVRPAHRRLLLIGDALSAGQKDFPHLENAGKEIERIRCEFPPGDSVLRTGADATPDAYAEAKPADFSLIHFAAHATANQDSPLDSAVVLTPSAEETTNCMRERSATVRFTPTWSPSPHATAPAPELMQVRD